MRQLCGIWAGKSLPGNAVFACAVVGHILFRDRIWPDPGCPALSPYLADEPAVCRWRAAARRHRQFWPPPSSLSTPSIVPEAVPTAGCAVEKETDVMARKTTTTPTGRASAQITEVPVDPEARWHRIATAAYYRAQARDFVPGYELQDWLEAEREFDAEGRHSGRRQQRR